MIENIKTGLIKNFYIIGFDYDKIFDEKFYQIQFLKNKNLHPKILSKFPEINFFSLIKKKFDCYFQY